MTKPTCPTVYLNGTSREALVQPYQDAYHALWAAIYIIEHEACPHARDYPNPEDFNKARAEHLSRLERLIAVRHELIEIAEHIAG